jgi:uncharacterized membrane protein
MNTGSKNALIIGICTVLGGIWSINWNPLLGAVIACALSALIVAGPDFVSGAYKNRKKRIRRQRLFQAWAPKEMKEGYKEFSKLLFLKDLSGMTLYSFVFIQAFILIITIGLVSDTEQNIAELFFVIIMLVGLITIPFGISAYKVDEFKPQKYMCEFEDWQHVPKKKVLRSLYKNEKAKHDLRHETSGYYKILLRRLLVLTWIYWVFVIMVELLSSALEEVFSITKDDLKAGYAAVHKNQVLYVMGFTLVGSVVGWLWASPILVGIAFAALAKIDHEIIAVRWLRVVKT